MTLLILIVFFSFLKYKIAQANLLFFSLYISLFISPSISLFSHSFSPYFCSLLCLLYGAFKPQTARGILQPKSFEYLFSIPLCLLVPLCNTVAKRLAMTKAAGSTHYGRLWEAAANCTKKKHKYRDNNWRRILQLLLLTPSPLQSGLSWQENEIAFAVVVARVQFISTWASARLKDSTPFPATPPSATPAPPPSPPPTLFAALSCIIKVAGKWLLPAGSRLEKRHGTQFVCLSTNLAIRQGLGRGEGALQHHQIKATCAGSQAVCFSLSISLFLCLLLFFVALCWHLTVSKLIIVKGRGVVSAHWFKHVQERNERGQRR